jgi:release factor glutamine methyltransferase
LITISQALNQSVETLQKSSDTPNLDSQILLASTLEKPRTWVISHSEEKLSKFENTRFQAGIISLVEGTPLPYIIGKWEFFGLEFFITPDTLIPRPETELMVEHALQWLDDHPGHRIAADIGTGSGCIAVALAKNSTDLSILASDISYSALKIAVKNSKMHEVDERVQFVVSHLLPPLAIQYDMICANLPYIPAQTLTALRIFGHEPDLALNGGEDGLDYITQLLTISPAYTKPGALLLIEIDRSQGRKVLSIANECFPSAEISLLPDLARNDRLIKIQL